MMKGTEKQVKYAMDILESIKLQAEDELVRAEKCIAERAAIGKPSRYGMAKKNAAENVLTAIDAIKESDIHAGTIINVLNSYNRIADGMAAYDNDVARMIKYTI